MVKSKRTVKRKLAIVACAALALIFVCLGAFFLYVSDYYRADKTALAVKENENVTRTEEGYLLSSNENTDTALIFYPGAKVAFDAYLPLLNGLSEKGLTCYLVEMPFNLAFFGMNAADKIIEDNPEIKHWYIAGHSLGGAMASSYAADNSDKVEGLILYGAYPSGDYPIERTLTVYGSLNTSVAEKIDYTENVVVIEGGNHAQFGNYGHQDGDEVATISAEKQQEQAIRATTRFVLQEKNDTNEIKGEVDEMEFSVPMALVDYIPVICFAIGAILLLRALHKKMDMAAFALFATGVIDIACAGALKATYKLLYATGLCDFQPLNAMFFPVQSIGFLLAGLGMLLMILPKKNKTAALSATVPPVFTGTFVFVGLMVAGLGIMDTVLCILCKKLKKNWLMAVFIVSFVCSLCMGYLSSQDFAEAAMNWIAQGVNVIGQGAFLVGVWQLHKAGLPELELK